MAVCRRRKREVGEREDGTALADTAAVQMLRFDFHAGPCVAVTHFEELDASLLEGKTVVAEKVKDVHFEL